MYRRTEVAHLHVGQEFVDSSDIPHVIPASSSASTPPAGSRS